MAERTDEDWKRLIKSDLTSSNPVFNELYELIIKQLPIGLKDSRFENFESANNQIKLAANHTIEYIRKNPHRYCEDTPFLKWVMKVAVRQLLYEFRFEEWELTSKNGGGPQVPEDWYTILAHNEFLQYAHKLFRQELSENQKIAIRSMVMFRMPKEELMRLLNMERCDYFEMIHDARLRIKRCLQKDGVLSAEVIADQ